MRGRIVMTVMAMLTLGGCAVPRGVGMYVHTQTALPMPPGGRQARVEVQPSVVAMRPGWTREVDDPLGVDEARAWYDRKIQEKGWTYYSGHTCEDGTVGTNYHRGGCMIQESLSLEVRPRPGGARVRLDMDGSYWWDFPSQLPFLPFYMTLGESDAAASIAELMGWL